MNDMNSGSVSLDSKHAVYCALFLAACSLLSLSVLSWSLTSSPGVMVNRRVDVCLLDIHFSRICRRCLKSFTGRCGSSFTEKLVDQSNYQIWVSEMLQVGSSFVDATLLRCSADVGCWTMAYSGVHGSRLWKSKTSLDPIIFDCGPIHAVSLFYYKKQQKLLHNYVI